MIMIRYLLNFIKGRRTKDLSYCRARWNYFRGSGDSDSWDLDRRGEGELCPVSVCFSMSVSCHFPRMDPVIRASCSLFTVTGHNQALRPGNTALSCLETILPPKWANEPTQGCWNCIMGRVLPKVSTWRHYSLFTLFLNIFSYQAR